MMKTFIKRLLNIQFILVLFIGLGLLYSVATPIFEAPDEVSHYAVIQNIIDGYGLPVQQSGLKTAWEQEGSQPPLYYLLMASTVKWIDTSDAVDRMYHNPHAVPGDPSLDANRNLVIHSDAENFPWRQTTLVVHLIRFLSIALGALTVFLGYQIARRIFPDRLSIALGTATLIAFNPMFLFISASVNNDNLTILLSSAALYMLIVCWQEMNAKVDRAGWLRRIALGSLLGLLALSKISGLTLLPVVGLILTIRHLRQRDWRGWIASGLIIGVLVVAIAGWWYWRNQQLYGDWLGLNMMVAIAGPRVPTPTLAQLISEFDGFRYSYWALFGAVNIVTFPAAYVIFDAFSAAALIGWLVWLVRAWRRSDRDQLTIMTLLAVYSLIVFVGVIRWTMLTPASQGRLMFPAVTVISLGMWLGWATLWSILKTRLSLADRVLAVGQMIMPVFMLGTALIVPFRDIIPTYAGPTGLTIDQLPNDLAPVQVDYGGVMRLIGYRLPIDQAASRTLDFTLYWQCLTQPTADFSAFIIVYGRNQNEVGKRDAYPFHGLFATRQCTTGMIFADPYRVPLSADADRPTVLRVQVGLKDWQHSLELAPSIGNQQIPALIFIAGKLAPVAIDQTSPHKPYAHLGDRIELDSGSIPTQARSGESLPIDLHWHALSTLSESYTVFVHLLDEQGHTVAQSDGLPVNGDYPTNWWASGEMILDEHQIKLPPDLPIGNYRIAIGLYRLADNTRLPVVDDLGQALPDDQFIWPQVIQIQN
jgi:Dolichyl-phosphate-mannose-protein mannosyltransferase